MEKRTVASVDAAIAELTSLALAGDVAGALEIVDQVIRLGAGSTFVWAQLQAQLLHAAMDDPRMPAALLAALIDRFRWADPISVLNRFHPDLRARVATRLAAAHAWLDGLQAAARRLDDVGAAAGSPCVRPTRRLTCQDCRPARRALQGCVNGALRFAPLLDAIDPKGVERLDLALRADAAPLDPLAYVGVADSRLPEGARWAIALVGMYTIVPARDRRDARTPFASRSERTASAILRDYWGVAAEAPQARRELTIDRIAWLLNEGHRADPHYAEPGDPEAPVDLLAWDLARAAMTDAPRLSRRMSQRSRGLGLSADNRAEGADELRTPGATSASATVAGAFAGPMRHTTVSTTSSASSSSDPRSPWARLSWRTRLDEDTRARRRCRRPERRAWDRFLSAWRRYGRLGPQVAALLAVALIVVGWEGLRRLKPAPIAAAGAERDRRLSARRAA